MEEDDQQRKPPGTDPWVTEQEPMGTHSSPGEDVAEKSPGMDLWVTEQEPMGTHQSPGEAAAAWDEYSDQNRLLNT